MRAYLLIFFFQGKGREMPKGESRCDWAVRRSADWSGLGGGHFGKRSPSRVFRSGWVVELFSIQSDVSGAGASRWSPIARTFSGRRARAFNNSSTPPFCCRDESFFFFSIETVVVAVDSRRSQTILCQVLERNDENPIRTPLL